MEENNIYLITAALADPLRLSAVMYLIRQPASVTEMVNHLEVSQSNLSNHLAVLKKAGLIKSTANGRQKIYELANAEVAQLIELMLNLQPPSPRREQIIKPIQFARTCYDHIAGKLGVGIFGALVTNGAIVCSIKPDSTHTKLSRQEVIPGPNAEIIFRNLGVDVAAVSHGRRQLAFGCLDWTERTPHLGGALGAALCREFFERKWIIRKDASRTIAITPGGKKELHEIIGLDADRLTNQ